jgi:hypothetical protein
MTTPATRNDHDNTPERVLFMAFELSEKTWPVADLFAHDRDYTQPLGAPPDRKADDTPLGS